MGQGQDTGSGDIGRELRARIDSAESRFDRGILALTFSALALSFQFSPKMGHEWPWALVSSWAVMLVSGGIGGWRMMHKPVTYQWALIQNEAAQFVTQMDMPTTKLAVAHGQIGKTSNPGEKWTEQERAKAVENRRNHVKKANEALDGYNKLLPRLLSAQIYTLLLGGLLLLLFASANFLHSPNLS